MSRPKQSQKNTVVSRKAIAWSLVVALALILGFYFVERSGLQGPDGSEWQALWSFMTFLVAAGAAIVALQQLEAHYQAQREQSRPYIIVDFAFRSRLLLIEVRNAGLTPAKNIKFTWDTAPAPIDPKYAERLTRNLVQDGISFLAPGREIRYVLGMAPDYWASDETPKRLEVTVAYADLGGNAFGADETMILDLTPWSDALADNDYENKNWNQFKLQTGHQKEIVRQLNKLNETLKKSR